MAWYLPDGMVMNNWTPATTGTGWTPSPILAPIAPIANKVLVLTGLDHENIAVPPPPAPVIDPDVAGVGCFLNMIPVSGRMTDPTRTSIDQALLPVLNASGCGAPPLSSMQIGIQGDNGLCGEANCEFSREISWQNGVALPNSYDPNTVFDAMFSGMAPQGRKSILDSVLAQAKTLSITLSSSDRLKLDEHFTLVRNVETRLQRLGKSGVGGTTGPSCATPPRPSFDALLLDAGLTPSGRFAADFSLFVDLMAIAFQCDITRSITFMAGSATTGNSYQFLTGSPTPHHTLSQQGDPASLAELTQIDTYEIQQAAAMLTKLDSIIEADGQSILDHTTFYLSCDVADGQAGNHWDMPVLLAGGASGALKIDGRHINYTPSLALPRTVEVGPRNPNQNTGQVFISILQAHGIMQDTFGMATGGPLPELLP